MQGRKPDTVAKVVTQACDEFLQREVADYESVLESETSMSASADYSGTIPDTIMRAVVGRTKAGDKTYTRVSLRDEAGIDPDWWIRSFNPTMQGMRVDEPGGAPNVGARYKGVFRRVSRGEYVLTEYGQKLLQEYL